MANRLNPQFPGNVRAQAFTSPLGITNSVFKRVNGVTPVNVFGSTNGFRGSIIQVRAMASTSSAMNVEVYGTNGTVCTINASGATLKGSTICFNGVLGTAFGIDGTLIAATTPGGVEAVIEVVFVAADPFN